MKHIYDLCSSREIPGKEKKAWSKHGVLIVQEDGRMSVKLESMPVGEWNGWLSVFEKRNNEPQQAGSGGMGDDIPFAPSF